MSTLREAAEALAAECEKRFWCPAECRALRAALAEEMALAAEMSQWEKAADEDQEKARETECIHQWVWVDPFESVTCQKCGASKTKPPEPAPAGQEENTYLRELCGRVADIVEARQYHMEDDLFVRLKEAARGERLRRWDAHRAPPAADGEEVRTLKAKLAILKLITKEPGLDDVQIAERLGVPVIVVSLLMAGLYEDGLVEEHRAGEAKGE